MKFKIKKDILLENLNNVARAISSKNLIPVLSGINFELTEKGLVLTACDNEIMLKSTINKKDIEEILEPGSIVISGKYIVEIIRKIPTEIISINVVDGSKMNITTETSEFSLNGMDSVDFPIWNIDKTNNVIKLPVKTFKDIISKTLFATGLSETRPILTGINFKCADNKLICTATDSYRLAKYEVEVDDVTETNIVIPSRSLSELNKIVDDKNDLEIKIYQNKIVVEYGNVILQSKLLSGVYPNTDHLLVDEFKLIVEINTEELYEVIDRVSLLNMDKEKNTISFIIKDNQAILSSTSIELGKANETINIVKNKEEDFDIAFSSKFIMEALKTIDTDKTIIKLNDKLKPVILEATTNSKAIQVILPIITG